MYSLQDLISKYPGKPWGRYIFCNSNVSPEFLIQNYSNEENFWDVFSEHPGVTINILNKYINKPWNWMKISYSGKINIYDIEKYINYPWNWESLSYCKRSNIFLLVDKYPDKPWDWAGLSSNMNITSDIIIKYINKPWNWVNLSGNPSITFDIVKNHPHKPWHIESILLENFSLFKTCNEFVLFNDVIVNDNMIDWKELSFHYDLTFDFILKYKHKPWVWRVVCEKKIIKMEYIEIYPNIPWSWEGLSGNPNLNERWIEKYIDKPWDWGEVSMNSELIFNKMIILMEKYPEIAILDVRSMLCRMKLPDNLSEELINKYIEVIGWRAMSFNPSLNIAIVDKYSDKPWNWHTLTMNEFDRELKETSCLKIQKKWRWYCTFIRPFKIKKIIKIQEWWLKLYYKPGGKASKRAVQRSIDLYEKYINL